MANNKKYISLNRLSNFLDNLKNTFALLSHKHTTADITDYKVDSSLSSTSTNPVQNKVLDAEFDAIATAMNALDAAIDDKAASSHTHDDRYYTESEINTKLASKSDTTHNHDSAYDAKGSASAVQENLDTVSDTLDEHATNTNIHVTTANKSNWNSAYTHSTSAHARVDATKVEDSTTNGNIKINGAETNVYSHPNSGVTAGTYKSVIVNAQGHITGGSNPTTLAGYGITDADPKGAADSALASAKTYADNAANTVKNDLLNNAGAAYDTLKELGDLIDDNKDAIDALNDVAAGKANATHTHVISDVSGLQTQLDGKASLTHIHPYGVCSSSATYTTKTVTVDNFSLVEGARVIVKFTNANSASSPKLNVNSTGAIPIVRYGSTAAGSNAATNGWEAGAVLAFTYDGTSWIRDYWYNTTYSNIELGQGFGYCYTSSTVADKEVSMSNYEAKTGGIVSVKFTYSVNAGEVTMNINGQGAKPVNYMGSDIIDDVIDGGDIATFIYTGSTYHLISVDRWFEDIVALQANDKKVRQMPTSTNGNFRLLLTPSFQSEDTTAYTYFDNDVYLNPYYNKLYGVDIDGSATGVKGVTAGNFLVGNDDDTMVEKTPAEVLSMINGASVATMTTAEYNALETTNANTLYMLTDAEEEEEVLITVDDIDAICGATV